MFSTFKRGEKRARCSWPIRRLVVRGGRATRKKKKKISFPLFFFFLFIFLLPAGTTIQELEEKKEREPTGGYIGKMGGRMGVGRALFETV